MSNLKKPATSLKEKFDVARSVELPPASPMRPTPVPPATANPAPYVSRQTASHKTTTVSLPFTFAFQQSDYEAASQLAATIGCTLEDILLLIAKRFDERALDLTITRFPPRHATSKRVLLKISQDTIEKIRLARDPLSIRSDGYLLRAPVIVALDAVATQVLLELKYKYDA